MNIGDLAKPATSLIERVSEAFGIVYAPTHVKRMARAEVEADKIRAIGRLEVNELESRGLARFVKDQARIQENLESITSKAVEDLAEDAKPEDIEEDWLASFFEECKHISNPEMQTVWSRILTGEANKPGTFSQRTIKLMASMGKREAESFTALCTFVWMIGEMTPLIFEFNDPIYAEAGVNFNTIHNLAALGLVNVVALGVIRPQIPKPIRVFYYGTPLAIESKIMPFDLPTGYVTLSQAGQELASICGSRPKDGFIEYCLNKWNAKRLITYSPYPRQVAQS